MKYKIGELEVEAVQWNGYNFEEITKFVDSVNDMVLTQSYVSSVYVLYFGDERVYLDRDRQFFIIFTETTVFTLSEQDFNKMAVRVKEPKFKAGDKVYHCSEYGIDVMQVKKQIIEATEDIYILEGEGETHYYEYELFTLEEAIEKLKEL